MLLMKRKLTEKMILDDFCRARRLYNIVMCQLLFATRSLNYTLNGWSNYDIIIYRGSGVQATPLKNVVGCCDLSPARAFYGCDRRFDGFDIPDFSIADGHLRPEKCCCWDARMLSSILD